MYRWSRIEGGVESQSRRSGRRIRSGGGGKTEGEEDWLLGVGRLWVSRGRKEGVSVSRSSSYHHIYLSC